MTVGIYTNTFKDKDLLVTNELICALKAYNIAFFVEKQLSKPLNCSSVYEKSKMQGKFDILIVVGGDGTILNIVKECASLRIPILAINLGHLGFLTEVETGELSEVVRLLSENKYLTESRSMIDVYCNDKFVGSALNECVVSRASDSKMISLKVFVNSQLIDNYICDGVLISTPTGSTAYSLSAGGPILSPSLDALCITPVSPHSLHSRPIVVGGDNVIELSCTQSRAFAVVLLDGRSKRDLGNYETVKVIRSKNNALFVRMKKPSFYQKLLKKLNKWSSVDEEN